MENITDLNSSNIDTEQILNSSNIDNNLIQVNKYDYGLLCIEQDFNIKIDEIQVDIDLLILSLNNHRIKSPFISGLKLKEYVLSIDKLYGNFSSSFVYYTDAKKPIYICKK